MKRIGGLVLLAVMGGAFGSLAAPAPEAKRHAGGGAARPPAPTVPATIRSLYCDGRGTVDAIGVVRLQGEPARMPSRRFWRLAPNRTAHPAEALLGKHGAPDYLSPDGKTVIVTTSEGDVLASTETGAPLVDGFTIGKAMGFNNAESGVFSPDGRWSAWTTFRLDPKTNKFDGGFALFDRDTKKIVGGPRGFFPPKWVSTDGKLFAAETVAGKKKGYVQVVADMKGKILFPKVGDPGLVPSGVSQSADGRRVALTLRLGDGAIAFRVYAMPGFRLLREHTHTGMSSGSLTPDGRFLLLQKEGPTGEAGEGPIASSYSLVEAETGTAVDIGDRFSGASVYPCNGAPGRFAVVHPAGEAGSRVEVVGLEKLLGSAALPRFAKAKEAFGKDLVAMDGTRAWRALMALRAQGVTRAEAKAAAGTLPVFGEADRKLVAGLGARFASTDFAEREQAAAAARGLIERFDENTFRAKVLPTLEALRRSEDAEVRAQARALLRYQPGRGTVTAAVLASRLEALEP